MTVGPKGGHINRINPLDTQLWAQNQQILLRYGLNTLKIMLSDS